MSMTPDRRFLGLEGAKPDDRTLLALPAGEPLKSGQVEAALERRADEVARHPLAGSPEARRLLQHLELAADRLQAELALAGKGPLHPAAARRAANRVRAATGAAGGVAGGAAVGAGGGGVPARPAVVAPSAIRKPGSGLTADDLTEFDRVALAVLVVSGGWNATSAKRLAIIAEDFNVSVADLERVVLGLTEFLSQGEGLRDAMGEVGETARSSWMAAPHMSRADAAEGAVERVFTRINDVLRDEVGGGTAASQMRLTVIFALFALSWIGGLGWLFFSGGGGGEAGDGAAPPAVATTGAGSGTDASSGKGDGAASATARGDVDANGKAVGPIAALAAPAKFPRPPGFVPSATPAAIAESASGAASWVADLEEAARALAAAKGRIDNSADSTRAVSLAQGALSLAADAWPAAGGYRADAVRAFGTLARSAQGADAVRRMMQIVPGSAGDLARPAMPAWQRDWRQAFGCGVLASVALDPTQSPELAAAAREEMRQRSIPIPRGKTQDPFATAAVESLAAATPRLAEQVVFGSATTEDVARWNEAVLSASSTPALRIGALLRGIDAVLRAPGALDQPGPIVDTLAFLIRSLDFTGRGAEAEPVRNALSAWILDKNIPPTRIWVFTSLLDADLGIAWYGPDLVLATNADDAARSALAERVDGAFPRVVSTSVGEAIAVDEPQLDLWRKGLEKLRSMPGENEPERLRNAAAALAFARVVRGFERGDEKLAKAGDAAMNNLLDREATEWIAPPGGMRPGLPASGVSDGSFVSDWTARRDAASRMEAVRSLRARPAAGDLGPLDARLAVVEALRGGQAEVRSELARVLIDKYANGRDVLRALLDALADGAGGDDARIFVGAMSGATVAGRDWISEGRRGILEKLYQLDDSFEHAVDATSAEIASEASALATAFGKGAGLTVNAARPDRALAVLADAMRTEAATRFLAEPFPASIEEVERQRTARRSLAVGLTQRMAAETPAIVDYAAMLVVARQPALRSKVQESLVAARRARTTAQSSSEQVAADLAAMLAILGESLAPKATERSGA